MVFSKGPSTPESAPSPALAYIELPVSPQEERLPELFTADPEIVDQYRPQLWAKVDQALATAINPHERQSIMRAAHILDWQLFHPADPLPEGLVIGENRVGRLQIKYDARVCFRYECATAAIDRLSDVGIGDVTRPVQKHLDSHESRIRSLFEADLMASPTGALIRSFNIEIPADPVERPLLPAERDIREQQVRHAARIEHAMPSWQPFRTHPAARTTVSRGLQRVEEETIRRRDEAKSNDDAFARVRSYFDPIIATTFENYHDEPMTGFITNDEDSWLITSARYPKGMDISNTLHDLSSLMVDEHSTGLHQSMYEARVSLLYNFLSMLYSSPPPDSYSDMLRDVVDQTTEGLFENASDVGVMEYSDDDDALFQLRHWPRGVLADEAMVGQAEEGHPTCEFYRALSKPGFMTHTAIERQQRTIIGHVEESLPPGSTRLIQVHARQDDLPTYDPAEDLAIILWDQEFRDADPYIPGYRLVSRSVGGVDKEFGFIREAAGDPYAPVEVSLDDEQRRILHTVYESLGLHDLAETIDSSPGMTVEELRVAIQRNGTYVIPGDASTDALPFDTPAYFHVDSIDDFRRLIYNGKLHGQCTIFGSFYQLSLEAVFGKGTAALAVGYVLNGQYITASRHEQVIFTHGGRVYISDATPFDERAGLRSAGARQVASGLPRPPAAQHLNQQDVPIISKPVIQGTSEERRKRLLENARTTLETQLTVVLRVADRQAMYEKVARLPEHDPIRRMLELVIACTGNGVGSDQLHALWQYIENFKGADKEFMKQMGLRIYDPLLLNDLQETLGRIAHASGYTSPDASIARIVQQVEAARALLPHDELVIAGESVAWAHAFLSQVDVGKEPLRDVQESLLRAAAQLQTATQNLERYTQEIT